MPAIGKFQIAQMDTKTPCVSATALDDVAGADREPVGKTINLRNHDNLLGNSPGAITNAIPLRLFRDTYGHILVSL
jgi:hypothetical protein